MKGTFNQGWWNCFESFATELSHTTNGYSICMSVLQGAGITKREATAFINKSEHYYDRFMVEIVKDYLNKIS